MSNYARLVRSHFDEMPAYQPVLPYDVLSEQLGRSPESIIKLDANENPYGPLPIVSDALSQLTNLHIYPDPESRHLRTALSKYHHVPIENLLAGAGADELIDLIMRLFLDPGDAIVDCPPTFGMYSFDAGVNEAKVFSVRRKSDFSLDLDALEEVIEIERPKLLFLATPNNPDGGIISREIFWRLLELPVILVLDEAYVEFADEGATFINEVSSRENLIVLRTFSKWAGLAGIRVGYGAFPKWMMSYLWKIKQPYNVSVAASAAATISLQYASDLMARTQLIIKERERLYNNLDSISWIEPYPSQANFVLGRIVNRAASEVKNRLYEAGILIRYFDSVGLDDHIRVSVGKPEHTDVLVNKLYELE